MTMDNKLNKFVEWIQWNKWKRIIRRIKKGFNLLLNYLFILLKFIRDFSYKLVRAVWNFIGGILFPVAFVSILFTLFLACYKFLHYNEVIHGIIETIKCKIPSISENEFMKHITDMEVLIRRVLDGNTLTFLITFIIVFLGTILLNIEDRARKHIKKAEKIIDKLECERNAMLLYTRLHILFSYYANKDYYRIRKEIENLLKEFRDIKYKYISKEMKSYFVNYIKYDILYYLDIDQKRNKKNENVIKAGVEALKKLQKEIECLKEV